MLRGAYLNVIVANTKFAITAMMNNNNSTCGLIIESFWVFSQKHLGLPFAQCN